MSRTGKSKGPVPGGGEIVLYQTEDGQTRIQCRFEDKAIWLTQKRSARRSARRLADIPGWKDGEAELRELRKQVTFAVFSEEEDLDKVAATVESLFNLMEKAFRK